MAEEKNENVQKLFCAKVFHREFSSRKTDYVVNVKALTWVTNETDDNHIDLMFVYCDGGVVLHVHKSAWHKNAAMWYVSFHFGRK